MRFIRVLASLRCRIRVNIIPLTVSARRCVIVVYVARPTLMSAFARRSGQCYRWRGVLMEEVHNSVLCGGIVRR